MFEFWQPSRYERIMYEQIQPRTLAAQCAGISRALRISHEPHTIQQEALWTVASGVVAPLVFTYVWWLLRSASENGVRRIYFMARDGQIFLEAAREMAAGWGLDIDLRYLYCSRESLFLPSYQRTGEFELYWIPWGYAGTITLEEVCRRVQLKPDELAVVNSAAAPNWQKDQTRPIPRDDLPLLYGMLKESAVEALIRNRCQLQFTAALDYLCQEGILDGVPFALADTGWRGSSQYALSALLHKGGVLPPQGLQGYYVGINRDALRYGNDTLQAFLFDWREMPREYRLYCFICFEMMFSADHGRTLRYRQSSGKVEPVLDNGPVPQVQEIISVHHRFAVDYARNAVSGVPFAAYDESLIAAAKALARCFISSPAPAEAEFYGECPMASEMGEGDYQDMAPSMNFWQFINCLTGRERIRGFWPHASLVRGDQPLLLTAYNSFLDLGILDWYRRVILRY